MAKVTYAKLNRIMFIPTIGEIPLTLPPLNRSWELVMETQDNGLLLNIIKGGVKHQAVIPYGNLDGFVLDVSDKAYSVKLSK